MRFRPTEPAEPIDINLIPLVSDDPFTESKSELKFFEAGILKVPTVAAATDPFRRAVEDGVDGFVANGIEEWTEKLENLIINKELREKIGEKAREKAIEKYSTINAKNEEYYQFLRSKIG